jgi:hypothetical protein
VVLTFDTEYQRDVPFESTVAKQSKTRAKIMDGVRYGAALTSSTTDILSNVSSHTTRDHPVSLVVVCRASLFSQRPAAPRAAD